MAADEFDDDDRPARRPRNSRDDDDDRPPRRRDRDDRDDYDDAPRSSGGKPHRGGMILTFGIIGIICCGIFAILAAIMGSGDLKEMAAGRMDRSGEGMTRVGQILGFVGIGLWVLGVIVRVGLMATNR